MGFEFLYGWCVEFCVDGMWFCLYCCSYCKVNMIYGVKKMMFWLNWLWYGMVVLLVGLWGV